MALDRNDLLDDIINTRIELAIVMLTIEDERPDDWDIDMAAEYIAEAICKLELLL